MFTGEGGQVGEEGNDVGVSGRVVMRGISVGWSRVIAGGGVYWEYHIQ